VVAPAGHWGGGWELEEINSQEDPLGERRTLRKGPLKERRSTKEIVGQCGNPGGKGGVKVPRLNEDEGKLSEGGMPF